LVLLVYFFANYSILKSIFKCISDHKIGEKNCKIGYAYKLTGGYLALKIRTELFPYSIVIGAKTNVKEVPKR